MRKGLLCLTFLFCCLINAFSQENLLLDLQKDGLGNNIKYSYSASSVLSTGDWYKIATNKNGVYKISYSDLENYGFSLPITSENIKIYGNGGNILSESDGKTRIDDLREISVFVSDGGNGFIDDNNDFILFYSEGPVSWKTNDDKYFYHTKNIYSDWSYYFINVSVGQGKRIKVASPVAQNPDLVVNNYNDYAFHEKDTVNVLKTGKLWLGEVFQNKLSYDFNFFLPNICYNSKVFINAVVAARSSVDSRFDFATAQKTDTLLIPRVDQSPTSEYAKLVADTFSFYPVNESINLTVSYNKPDIASKGWLNFIDINVFRELKYNNSQFEFRNVNTKDTGVAGYNILNANGNLKVWNITNAAEPVIIPYSLFSDTLKFSSFTDTIHNFVVCGLSDFFSPVYVEKVSNQNLHGLGYYDMIIISHPNFYEQAARLAQYHSESDGLSVYVTQPQIIYNEFSSGKQDVSAIRDFVKMFYDRAEGDSTKYPRYLLLFGDGSFDMKNRLANNTNFIPTYQTNNSLVPTASYVSDDFYGVVDDANLGSAVGKIHIGIGRIPAKNPVEAKNMVDKVIRYSLSKNEIGTNENNLQSKITGWKNNICFVADDEDNNLHLNQAEGLCSLMDSTNQNFNINKIYLDAFLQENTTYGPRYPEVNKCINSRIDKGALLFNYTGHGGEFGLTAEEVLMNGDIFSWDNDFCLPLFVTATCEFSRYDNPETNSAGENILLRNNGGGIALMTTTRVSFAHSNEVINRNLLRVAFDFERGNPPRLGDIVKNTKNACGSGVYKQNFTLLGDPAIQLNYPKYNIVTTTINNNPVGGVADTLNNYQKVTVSGYVEDNMGSIKTDFNGIIYPEVFDKPVKYTTNANDYQSYRQDFSLQNKVLYKGKASVVNGVFSFSFMIPRDVNFNRGLGRISYYAENNNNEDANGFFNGFTIIPSDSISDDTIGPEIKLYMNDRSFVEGGITGSNPKFIADIYDESGVNFFNNGLGHDIIAVVDGNVNEPLFLNDYFNPDIDNYKNGSLSYRFNMLSVGTHKILLRVWDVFDKVSEKTISFVVPESNGLELSDVYCFPNPFSDKTNFSFVHNIPVHELRVLIRIYNYEGVLLRNIESKVYGDSGTKHNIEWDGTDDSGNKLRNGIFFYKLRLYSENDKYLERTNKLIIIN
jgi:hypothetical protein